VDSSIATVSLVKRLHLAARAAIDAALIPFDVSTSQYSVLRCLEDDFELTGAALARQLFVTAQTMSRTLAGLEQAGLIVRLAGNDNANTTRNRLSAAGLETVTTCRTVVQTTAREVLSPLSIEEQESFQRALIRCVEAAEQLAGD